MMRITCFVDVKNLTSNSRSPDGVVNWSMVPAGGAVGQFDPTVWPPAQCTLSNAGPGVGRCQIDYEPSQPGQHEIHATYNYPYGANQFNASGDVQVLTVTP
jgi:hypothetical protein